MPPPDLTNSLLDPALIPQPGTVIDRKYRIERMLGVGGMGVVLSAIHETLGERVALKFLLPDLVSDEVFVARFQREAKAAARIRSEHVARVLDVSTSEEGLPYIVMEFLEGEDLGAVLQKQKRVAPDRAISYVLQACEALAEAHAQGIVHRDLKPENLFVTVRADGSELVKVMDFGISKISSGPDNVSLTQTSGNVMGSPLYMAPEQMRSAKEADPRTDIWALGTILFELIVGEAPFFAESLQELVAMIVQDPVPSLSERAKAVGVIVPPEFDKVITKALAKRPAERFADIGEFTDALAPLGDLDARASALRASRVLQRRGSSAAINPAAILAEAGATGSGAFPPRPDVSMTQPTWGANTLATPRSRPSGLLIGGIAGLAALVVVVTLVLASGSGKSELPNATLEGVSEPSATKALANAPQDPAPKPSVDEPEAPPSVVASNTLLNADPAPVASTPTTPPTNVTPKGQGAQTKAIGQAKATGQGKATGQTKAPQGKAVSPPKTNTATNRHD